MGDPLLGLSAHEAVRRVALDYVAHAQAAAARLGDDDDAESLHAFRVSVRKLRSCLRVYDDLLGTGFGKKARGRLKKFGELTNPGRDAEVQLEWVREMGLREDATLAPGIQLIETRLEERRADGYRDVQATVADTFAGVAEKIRDGLSSYRVTFRVGESSPLIGFGPVAAGVLERQLAALVGDLRRVESTEDEAIAHEARIHGKRLRYQLEPLRDELEGAKDLVRELKALQDLLGDLNDLSNLVATLGQTLEDNALDTARRLRDAASQGYEDIERELEHDERPGLLALLRRVQADRKRLLGELLSDWLTEGGRIARLERDVLAATARLRGEADAEPEESVEIERKYLLRALPPYINGRAPVQMEQGYLPGDRLIERVRKTSSPAGAAYVRTVKLGRGVKRVEVEEACEPAVFDTLWSLTEGRRVRKQRFAVPDGDRVWEIDLFMDRDLVLAEIELGSETEEVVLPDWLAPYVIRDVTEEPTYVNANLAR